MHDFTLWAAEESVAAPLDEHQVLVLLVQLALLVGVARLLGAAAKRLGQPPVVGELLAGIILGPSVFKRVWPDGFEWVFIEEPVVESTVFGFAWLGVIMLLVAIGFETDLGIIARFRRAALFVAAGSLLVPLAAATIMGTLVPASFLGEGASRPIFNAFFALALSVSALPVVAKILQDLGLLRRNFGQITLASGMTMDSVGWLLLAAASGVALSGQLDIGSLARSLGGLVGFVVVAATVGRWFIDRLFRRAMGTGGGVVAALTITILAALVGGAVTQALQLEAILGAFIVGILLGRTRHQLPQVRDHIESFTAAFFAPIFFAFSGLRVDLFSLDTSTAVVWAIVVLVVAIAAKVFGTYAGARLGGMSHREGLALGSGLSALGAMGIVVAIVALNLGVISDVGYTVLVLTAIVTSVVAPQLLKAVVRDWDIPPDERARLDEESLRADSMLLDTNRILLPTRGGANSAYAAMLIAGSFPDAETTVMSVRVTGRWFIGGPRGGSAAPPDEVLARLSDSRTRTITRRARDPAAAIVAESQFGYDLLVVGASGNAAEPGLFDSVTDRVFSRTHVPAVVVRFPSGTEVPTERPREILIPVTAGSTSLAAQEFAFAAARAAEGRATALHVVTRPEGTHYDERADLESRAAAIELVAHSSGLASRLGARSESLVRVAPHAEEEILEMANRGDFDLLVLGASTRALTNRPFFGHRVSAIVERSQIPVVIVALPDLSVRRHVLSQ